MISIVVSTKDPVGLNIHKILTQRGFEKTTKKFDNHAIYGFKEFELVLFDEVQIYADYLDSIETDCFVFASKHESLTKTPSLTVHPIGNWMDAKYGGKKSELVLTSSSLMKNYLLYLDKHSKEFELDKEYEVCYEVTHHGPHLAKPAVFIEVGSSIEHWNNLDACNLIADTILNSTIIEKDSDAFLGLGGSHYGSSFTHIAKKRNMAFSHMCAKHSIQGFNEDTLKKAINATIENVKGVVFDQRGLGEEKEKFKEIIENSNLEFFKSKKL